MAELVMSSTMSKSSTKGPVEPATAEEKEELQRRVWDMMYGELLDLFPRLSASIRRNSPPSDFDKNQAILEELKKIITFPKE